MIDWTKITGFDWDEGNTRKNEKHGVSMAEAEQVFFNAPLLVLDDAGHSNQEPRFHALGKTDDYPPAAYSVHCAPSRGKAPGNLGQGYAS